MDNLVEKIMNVDRAVRALYDAMIDQFNQDDMDYCIEFERRYYDFCKPMTKHEKYRGDSLKRKLILLFLNDAFKKLTRSLVQREKVSEDDTHSWHIYRSIWCNIANLQRATQKSDIVSKIISEAAYSVDEGTSKDLDYESIYIQAQRKDLSDEEKWNILLHNIVVQESLGTVKRANV